MTDSKVVRKGLLGAALLACVLMTALPPAAGLPLVPVGVPMLPSVDHLVQDVTGANGGAPPGGVAVPPAGAPPALLNDIQQAADGGLAVQGPAGPKPAILSQGPAGAAPFLQMAGPAQPAAAAGAGGVGGQVAKGVAIKSSVPAVIPAVGQLLKGPGGSASPTGSAPTSTGVSMPPLPPRVGAVVSTLAGKAAPSAHTTHLSSDASSFRALVAAPASQSQRAIPTEIPQAGPGQNTGSPAVVRPQPPGTAPQGSSMANTVASTGTMWAVAVAGLGFLLRVLVGLPLVNRIRRSNLLRHEARARIVALVAAQPGIHFSAIVRQLDLARGQAAHHLRALEGAGLVTKSSVRSYNCYFIGDEAASVQSAIRALKSSKAQRVLEVVKQAPDQTVRQVCQQTGLSGRMVRYHARHLLAAGLLHVTSHGRTLRFAVTPLGESATALATMRAGPMAEPADPVWATP